MLKKMNLNFGLGKDQEKGPKYAGLNDAKKVDQEAWYTYRIHMPFHKREHISTFTPKVDAVGHLCSSER